MDADVDAIQVARIAARGFYDDPVMSWVFPDDATRLDALALAFERLTGTFVARAGRVDLLEGSSTALWLAPDPPPAPENPPVTPGRPWHLFTTEVVERFQTLGEVMEAAHPTEPHWYLGVVASLPEMQGRGLGRRILGPVLDLGDREGRPAYLESSNPRNLPFYFRLGFVQIGEIKVPGGPVLIPMWREPGRATG
ncbi:MAG: GNAT family N-acetyltransferase [Actinomycetota bacterium]|nr:GNAT family N-acetyltransferase [Actinomycetota bacterium]